MTGAHVTPEQRNYVEKLVGSIGHNLGPAFDDNADAISKHVEQHHGLRAEATRIRVMVDMLRSHRAGEHLLPPKTAGYVRVGVSIVIALTMGPSMVIVPIPSILLDAVVVGFTIAALHVEIKQYVDWRSTRDPSYLLIKQELFGAH